MNVYLFELKNNRRFIINWTLILVGIAIFMMMLYPIFNEGMDEFITIINNFPEALKTAFGLNPETISSVLGFYAFTLNYIIICACVEAMLLGLNILSKEVREKTADFLLAKPVSRPTIVTSKILSSLTLIIITNIIFIGSFYLGLILFTNNNFNFEIYLLLTLVILFLQIFFLALGYFLAVIIPKLKTTIPLSLGTVFGLYILGTFTSDKFRPFIPFKYFKNEDILLNKSYDEKYLFLLLGLVIVLTILTYFIYKKKDISAV